jgi:SpoVK/Ycf46/Vps4 family AAA+-type ATPase
VEADRAKKTSEQVKRLRKKEAEWEWRRNYRVWEANRKVFVYPENWLEPDRDLRQVVAAVRAQCAARRQRVRNPRLASPKGIPVLFTGKNRLGALVAAQTLASDLRKDLYRVDLGAVVSKYIGETEKNLRCVFKAAEAGGAILLFDEAGALFGKRTEVKDSHDRYANMVVNYLLQRIEGFEGLGILTTKSHRRLDNASLRRFHFVIRVPK